MAELATYKARPIGVVRDVSASNADPRYYNFAKNFVFRDDKAHRQDGIFYRTNDPLFGPEAMIYRDFDGQNQILYSGQGGIGIDTFSQSDITPVGYPGLLSLGLHSWCDLNGIPVWNHPGFTPHYHDGNFLNAMLPIPAWPAGWYADRMIAHKFFLMALSGGDGSGDRENELRWSSSADPGLLPAEWIPSASNDAGDLSLSDTPGKILDAVALGDNLIAYKRTGSYFIEYLGSLFGFGQRGLFTTTGILAPGCAQEWRNQHFVVTQGDIIRHNGSSVESIVDQRIQRDIFDDISGTLIDRCFTYIDPRNLRFVFCWPSRNSAGWCDRKAIYDYADQSWSLEVSEPDELSAVAIGRYTLSSIGVDWDSATQAWDDATARWDDAADPSVGDQILEGYYADQRFGEPIEGGLRGAEAVISELIWSGKDLGAPTRRKMVDRIWLNTESPGGAYLDVQVGWQESYEDPITWGAAQRVTAGAPCCVSALSTGRLLGVRITSDDSKGFAVRGFDIDYMDVGPW